MSQPMHRIDSPADVSPVVYNNSDMFAEPLANAYLLRMTPRQLDELARSIGISKEYFVRRARLLRESQKNN